VQRLSCERWNTEFHTEQPDSNIEPQQTTTAGSAA
jgi:hypothetical protein